MTIGELFILGFFGKTVPSWLKEFAGRYGLGGVILFDYSCQTREYDNNIDSPEQLRALCAEIAALPSAPMVFIDQEGGLVRRLKDSRGFASLPSAKEFNHLAPDQKRAVLTASFAEMRRLGVHYDFAPVIDVDYNPDNPNIGRIKRSYSADIAEVEANALLASSGAAGNSRKNISAAADSMSFRPPRGRYVPYAPGEVRGNWCSFSPCSAGKAQSPRT